MKKLVKFISLSLLISAVCLLFACGGGGDGDGDDKIVPQSGEWQGSIIKFYVSPDSSKLTSSGSTLKDPNGNPYMLSIGPVSFTGACQGTLTAYFSGDIPISNLSWSYTSATRNISGTFTAANASNGSYSFNEFYTPCNGNIQSSGNWTATPKTTSSDKSADELADKPSTLGKPSWIVDLHDDVTGEVIGVMEIVYD